MKLIARAGIRLASWKWRAGSVRRTLAHVARHPRAALSHRRRFAVLAGPGQSGYDGGVFNPGAVACGDGSVMLVAKGQHLHWLEALARDPAQFMRGAPLLMRLAEPAGPVRPPVRSLSLVGFPADRGIAEDFRLFTWRDEVYANLALIERTPHGTRAFQVLANLDARDGALVYLGAPVIDQPLQPREKNWVYAERDGKLLLFYSFSPLRVFEAHAEGNWNFTTIVQRPLGAALADPAGNGAFVSFSTNPVPYGREHLFLVVHQVDRSAGWRRYLHWGVLLDRATLSPCRITAQPLFDGLVARGPVPGVLYVTSVIVRADELVFYCGEGDCYVTRCRLPFRELDSQWISVE